MNFWQYNVGIVLLVMMVATTCQCQSPASAQYPNVILIMADDQGWGDTGYNGHAVLKTPHLDAMAAEGIQFDRFYAAGPVCSPTRASCLTGRHPHRQSIFGANTGHLKKEEKNLAELLGARGYRTGHFGKWHLGVLTNDEIDANRGGRAPEHYAPPWERGFDVCFSTESKVPTWDPMVVPEASAGGIGNRKEGEHYGTYYWVGPGKKATENLAGDNSRIIMDRVIPFIEQAESGQEPFFAVIWFHTPHLPVLTGPDLRQPYAEHEIDKQEYYGAISAMDQQVGRLRQKLKELGLNDDTMLFYCSDNGPEGRTMAGRNQGSTKGLKGRKRSLHEGGIRVPGIWVWPREITTPKQVQFPASTSDYLPTILDALGVDLDHHPHPLDGTSLLPLTQGETTVRNAPIGFHYKKQQAWIDDQFKLYKEEDKDYEMYDILHDPAEQHNLLTDSLSTEQSAWLDRARMDLHSWLSQVEQSAAGNDY